MSLVHNFPQQLLKYLYPSQYKVRSTPMFNPRETPRNIAASVCPIARHNLKTAEGFELKLVLWPLVKFCQSFNLFKIEINNTKKDKRCCE